MLERVSSEKSIKGATAGAATGFGRVGIGGLMREGNAGGTSLVVLFATFPEEPLAEGGLFGAEQLTIDQINYY